jgi:hypothetical protein
MPRKGRLKDKPELHGATRPAPDSLQQDCDARGDAFGQLALQAFEKRILRARQR